jgi:structural maintenance of chromosome 4
MVVVTPCTRDSNANTNAAPRQVSIVANYIKERTKNAQFIVISLRNNMFELAARLVGVYKVNHMTKSVTIENKDYIDRPQPQQRH